MNAKRLIPHDGDFVISGWVECVACVRHWTTGRGAASGWFAIPKGTAHFVDPVTHEHIHTECVEEMNARDAWADEREREQNAAIEEVFARR